MKKNFFWQWRGAFITTPVVAALVILVRYLGWLEPTELFFFDQYVRWKPPESRDPRIAIVGIDENDVAKIGSPIIPDRIYADLITKLKQYRPRAIGLDIYRDLPVEPGHQRLVEVFQNTDNLVGIEKVIGRQGKERVAPPPVLKEKGQVGFNDVLPDEDNKVRRALLALPEERLYSFAMYLALLYLEQENITLETVSEENYWQLGTTVFVPLEKNDGGYVNADAGGYQMLLNYRGNTGHFETVSLHDVLENKLPPDWGKGRIVLVGFISESFLDVLLTPYTQTPSERMPGVEVHANIISQIISSAIDKRPLLYTWPDRFENLWIIYWAGMGAMIAWGLRKGKSSTQSLIRTISVVPGVGIVLIGITYVAFLNSWWIPIVPPLLAFSTSIVVVTAYVARSAGRIRHTFGRYLTEEIVNTLLESPEGIRLGGERRTITILTSDLRGFTALSEKVSPEEVVKILNYYLGCMANIITKYQGTIDEFMGDGILVLFGAPVTRDDDAERAVACAIAMQLEMKVVNRQMQQWGYPTLEMGIGINTGEVVVGNIGSEKRTKYGVVGSEVNLTYRIESYTVGGQILISEPCLQAIQAKLKVKDRKEVSPKGVKNILTIYQVVGIEGKYHLDLPEEKNIYTNLKEPILMSYSQLHEKDISQQSSFAHVIQLSPKGAKIKVDRTEGFIPELLKNIKLNLLDLNAKDDLYAKVVDVQPSENCFEIYFTHIPINISDKLSKLLCK